MKRKTPKPDYNANASERIKGLISILLPLGLLLLFSHFYYAYDHFYLGEPLIAKQTVIRDKPVYKGSRNTSGYVFTAMGFQCQFTLSHGALTIIKGNADVRQEIESIQSGDSILIYIRQADEIALQDPDARPRVIALSKRGKSVIVPEQVEKQDRKWYHISLWISIGVIGIWVGIRGFIWVDKKRDHGYII